MLHGGNTYFKKDLCSTYGKNLHVFDIMEANMHSKNVIWFHKTQLLISTYWFYLYNIYFIILTTVRKRDLCTSTQYTVAVQ